MKFKPILGAMLSGSMDGITASHNKGGPYFRSRVAPTNPQTTKQMQIRQAFTQAVNTWNSTLTQAERDAWDTFAPTLTAPEGVTYSGQNAFMICNVPAIFYVDHFAATLSFPRATPSSPTGAPTTSSPSIAINSELTGMTVNFDNTDTWANDDDGAMAFFVYQPAQAGKRPQDMQPRLALVLDGDGTTPPTSPVAVPRVWNEAPADIGKLQIVGTETIFTTSNIPGTRDLADAVALAV